MPDPQPAETLVVGCGNLLRGDDAAGPTVVRLLADRDLPAGVRLLDAGTAGMDVAFAMRGARRVILVDASRTGLEPGTIHKVPATELLGLGPPAGNIHLFTWDEALAFAQWLLGDDYPKDVTVYLVEGASFEVGAPLSPAVAESVERVADSVAADLAGDRGPA